MSERKYIPCKLRLVSPTFDSDLTQSILDLNYLRKRMIRGSTHPRTFFQIKEIFHWMESVGSARIEGNRTTLSEYAQDKVASGSPESLEDRKKEIANMEKAMNFIDEFVNTKSVIDRSLVSEIHKKVVEGLDSDGEGDKTPGMYRMHQVEIVGSDHIVPPGHLVNELMDELFAFVNNKKLKKQQHLLVTALSHHRFVWIHPFGNGNGRTVRLFTYAMLIKQGFTKVEQRIINPTAVFCEDRDAYYAHLSRADSGDDEGLLKWSEYVLNGLAREIEKIDKILDYSFMRDQILIPAIYELKSNGIISADSAKILEAIARSEKQSLSATELRPVLDKNYNKLKPHELSRKLLPLKKNKMISPVGMPNSRTYGLDFITSPLTLAVVKKLNEQGFFPKNLFGN
ncbi:MAG: Fic family protein [Candidatus Omnitrophica bacterium]|nr:Fic family protein [Candidatus Omnitrophota bacterium]